MLRRLSVAHIFVAAGAIAIVLLVVARFEWRSFNIPSGGMAPTLQVGDYLLVRHYRFIEPRRGDVAVSCISTPTTSSG